MRWDDGHSASGAKVSLPTRRDRGSDRRCCPPHWFFLVRPRCGSGADGAPRCASFGCSTRNIVLDNDRRFADQFRPAWGCSLLSHQRLCHTVCIRSVDATAICYGPPISNLAYLFFGFLVGVSAVVAGAHLMHTAVPFDAATVLLHSIAGLREPLGIQPIDGIVWILEVEIKFYILALLIAPLLRARSPLTLYRPFGTSGDLAPWHLSNVHTGRALSDFHVYWHRVPF